MISTEYTLVKWKDGDYEELEITIQENAVRDFCEMMDWDEEEFANNTVRRPIEVEEEEDDPVNSRQIIKPIMIDAKKLPKKILKKIKKESNIAVDVEITRPEIRCVDQEKGNDKNDGKSFDSPKKTFASAKRSLKKRKRRTKAEMIADGEQTKEPRVRKPRTNHLFPEEINDFIKENWEEKRDVDLVEMIEEKFDKTYKIDQVKANRRTIGCVANRPGAKVKKKIGPQKKWTDEVFQYLKENINNFSNKELCEELESQFNLKTNPTNIQQQMSTHGIKRDSESGANQEIIEFIKKQKSTDLYIIRDKIIEKFEVNMEPAEIRRYMKEALKGEEVADEVKRITQHRDQDFDPASEEFA